MTDMDVSLMPEFLFDEPSHTYTLDGKNIPSLTLLLRTLSDRILSHIPDPEVVERARVRSTSCLLPTRHCLRWLRPALPT